MRLIDLSREIFHRSPSYPSHPPTVVGTWVTHEERREMSGGASGSTSMYFSMSDHGTTHLDAPRHFDESPGAFGIDEFPLEKCYVMGICLDFRHIPPKAEIGVSEMEAAAQEAGVPVPRGGTVLLCTGHHARTYPGPAYYTDNPGVNRAATEWLARAGAVTFGIDSMRPGPEGSVNSDVHRACAELSITHMESLCNLEELIGKGLFRFIGFPLKIRNGSGGPIRAVAVLDE
ncbi:MAG: cyclase family protein [Nitrospinae bacterium]|nr:cyclase family protein [Nitrospinota bacterium]